MTSLFIAIAVIAIFGLGLLCALGVISCGAPPDHPTRDAK